MNPKSRFILEYYVYTSLYIKILYILLLALHFLYSCSMILFFCVDNITKFSIILCFLNIVYILFRLSYKQLYMYEQHKDSDFAPNSSIRWLLGRRFGLFQISQILIQEVRSS